MHSYLPDVAAQGREIAAREDRVQVQEGLAVRERAVALKADDLELLIELALFVAARPGVPVGQPRPLHGAGGADVGEVDRLGGQKGRQALDRRLATLESDNVAVAEALMSHACVPPACSITGA